MGHIESFRTSPDTASLIPGVTLPVARYRFVFRMSADLRLPEYAGSLLRGQFGAALRRTACMTGMKNCADCPLYRTCPYPAIFETPAPASHAMQKFSQVPNPYVIEPPPLNTRHVGADDCLTFSLVLMGRALSQLPLIVFAFQRAFRQGIGKQRIQGELEEVVFENNAEQLSIWDATEGKLISHQPVLEVPHFEDASAVRLIIHTPMRLQENGRALGPDALEPRRLVTAAMRRASLVFEIHADRPGLVRDPKALASHAATLTDVKALRWQDWTRYSSRQQSDMTLGGVLGDWTLHGDLAPVLPWLWLGQWLHVGKNATMGMGRYVLTCE